VRERIGAYLKALEMEGASPRTCRAYAADLRQFAAFLEGRAEGPVPPEGVDPLAVRAFVAARLKAGDARRTVARKLAAVRGLFQFCCREGTLKANPARVVPTPRGPERLPRYLTVDEAAQLLAGPPGGTVGALRDHALFEVAYSSGLRVGELTGLDLPDVDLEGGLVRVLGKGRKERVVPLGARAVQIADGSTSDYFLTTFGRSARETVSAHEVKTDPTLSQALHLLNGETVANKIRAGGVVPRLLEAGTSPEDVIKKLYVRAVCREPAPEELAKLTKLVAEEGNPQQTLEDIFWGLLNSREFLFNH